MNTFASDSSLEHTEHEHRMSSCHCTNNEGMTLYTKTWYCAVVTNVVWKTHLLQDEDTRHSPHQYREGHYNPTAMYLTGRRHRTQIDKTSVLPHTTGGMVDASNLCPDNLGRSWSRRTAQH